MIEWVSVTEGGTEGRSWRSFAPRKKGELAPKNQNKRICLKKTNLLLKKEEFAPKKEEEKIDVLALDWSRSNYSMESRSTRFSGKRILAFNIFTYKVYCDPFLFGSK